MTPLDPPPLDQFPADSQRRMDELLDKNSEGDILPEERTELEKLVEEAERLMVANAKRLAAFSQEEATSTPLGAIPVTVWVKPEQHAER